MADTEVLYEVDGAIARVTINRPERRNSMSFGVMQGLRDAIAAAKADAAVRVVVLTGAGDKAFCAGADLQNSGAAFAMDFSRPNVDSVSYTHLTLPTKRIV